MAHDHGPPQGVMRWLTTTNHKDIGTMYLVFSLVMFLVGGLMALVIRAEISRDTGSSTGSARNCIDPLMPLTSSPATLARAAADSRGDDPTPGVLYSASGPMPAWG